MVNQLLERFGIHKRPTKRPKSKNERTVQFCGTIHPTRTATKIGVQRLSTHTKTEYIGRFYTSSDRRRFRCDEENLATYRSMDGFTYDKHERKRTGADEANKIWREHAARPQRTTTTSPPKIDQAQEQARTAEWQKKKGKKR